MEGGQQQKVHFYNCELAPEDLSAHRQGHQEYLKKLHYSMTIDQEAKTGSQAHGRDEQELIHDKNIKK